MSCTKKKKKKNKKSDTVIGQLFDPIRIVCCILALSKSFDHFLSPSSVMSADSAVVEEEEVMGVSALHLAALHVATYILCVVAAEGLRSPLWLLLPLLYCGTQRDALLGHTTYPTWLWSVLWGSTLLSLVCGVGANVLTLLVRAESVHDVVWQQLRPLWLLIGAQRWETAAWLDTIAAPIVTSCVFGAFVFYMKCKSAGGLQVRRRGAASTGSESLSPPCDRWCLRWPQVASACRLTALPLLAALAWGAAWLSPPSCVGLWLEMAAFAFVGSALYGLHKTRLSSSVRFVEGDRDSCPSAVALARIVNLLFGSTVAVLVVGVCATHNAAFVPLSNAYGNWCAQIGVGHMALGTSEGVRRAMQLLGMAVVVVGVAAVDVQVMPSRASAPRERQGLLVAVTQEEEDEPEGERESAAGRHVAEDTHQENNAALPRSSAFQQYMLYERSYLSSSQLLVQVVAIACMMALLFHAVYFPSLVSLALWLTHVCGCAGGLVSQPRQPTTALCRALLLCLLLLSCAISVQYAALVLRANPSTKAWVWQPALPCNVEDSGVVAAQAVGEHGIALLLGIYLCTRGRASTLASTTSVRSRDEVSPTLSPATPRVQTASPLLVATAQDTGADTHDHNDNDNYGSVPASAPQRNWMFEQLRASAGDPRELRKVFETAVGRSPRSTELDILVTAASSAPITPAAFVSVRHLTAQEVFDYVAAGPLYTYVVIISLFVLGTSGAAMDTLHATCLVLSLLFSIVGSNAVLYRRLRTVPPVWVALIVGLQLGCRVLAAAKQDSSFSSTALSVTDSGWASYISVSALEWREAGPYLMVQLVLLWCYRYKPRHLVDWRQAWQCLVFRVRWTHIFRLVHNAVGFVMLLWFVLLLPRSVNVTLLILLLFCAALLHHLRWYSLAYVWRRYLLVGYCGVVLLAMLFVEFATMQPRLWQVLHALGCPVGSEGVCARDVGLPSNTTVWLTPLSLPWWFVIVLATAAGTPYALPRNLAAYTSVTSPFSSSPPSNGSASLPMAEALARSRLWWSRWWPPLQSTGLTVALLLAMTYAALHHPCLLTTAYLVGPVLGVYPAWTFCVAAAHTALQCTYQFWFSPPWLDTYTLWGTPVAQLIGLWRVRSPVSLSPPSATLDAAPSTLAVAGAPLLIALLQALQQSQPSAAAAPERGGEHLDGAFPGTSSGSLVAQALRRLCASHFYVLLLLCLLRCTQRFVMGWGVAVVLLVVWSTADLRECGVLLRPRWLYRVCATTTAGLAMTAYVLHWAHERFTHWPIQQRLPWLVGSGEGVVLSTVCWTAAAACVALQWSSGFDATRRRDTATSADDTFTHLHSANLITWLRQRIARHRGAFGIHGANSIADLTDSQRDAFLADAAELLDDGAGSREPGEGGDEDAAEHVEQAQLLRTVPSPSSVCGRHVWSIVVLQVARLVPLVACGFVAVGATSISFSPSPLASSTTPCLLTIALLITGLVMALRHSRLQWSFWQWWRPLVVGCAALPLSALLFYCPVVHDAVLALPPWIGLVIGLSSGGADGKPCVSGDGLRFTACHVELFFALWLQSSLFNNPQWGVRLLQLQYAEKQLGGARHLALQQQLVVQVARATAEATRVDREIRAYLDGVRAGDDVAETSTSIISEGEHDGGGGPRSSGAFTTAAEAAAVAEEEAEERRRNEAVWRLSDFGAEMVTRQSLSSSSLPIIIIPNTADTPALPPEPAAARETSSAAWRWWQQRCDTGLRRICNVLAAYTYHPAEYRVGSAAAAATITNATADGPLSLGQLLRHTLVTALQAVLRHTPLALLACTLANALLTGCLWELVGLCYVVQVALAYHPYAPRVVYDSFGFYVVMGVLLKQLVILWVTFDPASRVPAWVAGLLLPLHKGSAYPWTTADAAATVSRDNLHYHSLWMDVVTLAVVVLHERVCLIHGVYVDENKIRKAPQRSVHSAEADDHVNVRSTGGTGASEATATPAADAGHPLHSAETPLPPLSLDVAAGQGVRGALWSYYANVVMVPGVGEDWYISYTSVDLLALLMLAVTYSRMTANERLTLQDNVQNNQLPGPMALLLCMSVLQLVVDRMLYVQRCMRLKAAANWTSAVAYCLLYWWWRSNVAVSTHAAGNTYFCLKMIALVLSVTQVCRGYPLHRRRDAFTTQPGSLVHYSCFMVYRVIPFLWEVRTLIDWTVQHTALTLQEYLTLEDVYVHVYHCRERYVGRRSEHAKIGDAVTHMTKWLFGVSRLALILLALLGPLLYYSTYNPSTVVNKATQLHLELSFFGAHDFFTTTVHDDVSTPDQWWLWLARTRPTVAMYGQAATEQTVQLMEFTSCSSNQWMASPQAMRQILTGLRAAVDNDEQPSSAAYILQSLEMTRSASSATSTTAVSLVNRWSIPKATARELVRLLEKETGATTTTTTASPPNSYSNSSNSNSTPHNGGDHNTTSSQSSDDSDTTMTTAVLPFFYSPFALNRASRLDMLPTDAQHPHRNRMHCTLELHHERDAALGTMVRYWCLQCAPLFPAGNMPAANTSSAAEWRCLSTGEGCSDFNYEDVNETAAAPRWQRWQGKQTLAAQAEVPIYMVVLSDSVVVGISFLKGIGIVALYTTFVLALGRLLRSVLANKVGTLVFENMANPAVLENMVRCIGVAREYGDLRLEHTTYLELIDLLRSPERLFEVTGPLRCMYVDAEQCDVFRLGQVRRRGGRRSAEEVAAEEAKKKREVSAPLPSGSS